MSKSTLVLIAGDQIHVKRTRKRGAVVSGQKKNGDVAVEIDGVRTTYKREKLNLIGLAPGGGIGNRVYDDGRTVRQHAGLN